MYIVKQQIHVATFQNLTPKDFSSIIANSETLNLNLGVWNCWCNFTLWNYSFPSNDEGMWVFHQSNSQPSIFCALWGDSTLWQINHRSNECLRHLRIEAWFTALHQRASIPIYSTSLSSSPSLSTSNPLHLHIQSPKFSLSQSNQSS